VAGIEHDRDVGVAHMFREVAQSAAHSIRAQVGLFDIKAGLRNRPAMAAESLVGLGNLGTLHIGAISDHQRDALLGVRGRC
jgi:hypothetical protein